MTLDWKSSGHDDEPRDQYVDLPDGFWADCGPHRDGWSWTVLDFDRDNAEMAGGHAPDEAAVKAEVEAWAARFFEHTATG